MAVLRVGLPRLLKGPPEVLPPKPEALVLKIDRLRSGRDEVVPLGVVFSRSLRQAADGDQHIPEVFPGQHCLLRPHEAQGWPETLQPEMLRRENLLSLVKDDQILAV